MAGAVLRSDTAQVEWSGSIAEGKRTGLVGKSNTDSSWKGVEGDGERSGDTIRVTQHEIGASGGF